MVYEWNIGEIPSGNLTVSYRIDGQFSSIINTYLKKKHSCTKFPEGIHILIDSMGQCGTSITYKLLDIDGYSWILDAVLKKTLKNTHTHMQNIHYIYIHIYIISYQYIHS